ncbi:hypothetical protein B0T17DRAFT_475183, partial [Bombardia bombarda]
PATLSSPASHPLTPRESIADAIYRIVNGLDSNDLDLFVSGWTEDAVFDINGIESKGLLALKENLFGSISKLDTTHFVTNMRISISEGGETADLTANALSQHFRRGEGMKGGKGWLAGVLYRVEVVKVAGVGEEWKVRDLKVVTLWAEGDVTVMG